MFRSKTKRRCHAKRPPLSLPPHPSVIMSSVPHGARSPPLDHAAVVLKAAYTFMRQPSRPLTASTPLAIGCSQSGLSCVHVCGLIAQSQGCSAQILPLDPPHLTQIDVFLAQAYKHVSALLLRSMKRSPPERRINTFYVLSAICRQSKMQLKAADKYGERPDSAALTAHPMSWNAMVQGSPQVTPVCCAQYLGCCHRCRQSRRCSRRYPTISTCDSTTSPPARVVLLPTCSTACQCIVVYSAS